MQNILKLYVRRLITIVLRYVQVIILTGTVSISSNEYDMFNSHYDDANVLLQMMYKTPAAVS